MTEQTKNKIRVAVIGVGYLGEHHARIYSELPGVELVGVVDTHLERAEKIAADRGCGAYTDAAALFGKIDAASVVVPTPAHFKVAKSLLENGVDLLLEKPMTATLQEADALLVLAEQKGRMLQVGHVERFNAGVRKLKEGLVQPRFIECHRMGPFIERGTDVHVILDLMIHDIDIILSLVPSELVEVRATGVPVLSAQIDIANVRLAFANGCVANVTASRVSRERMRKIRIFQPDTYLSLDYLQQELVICRRIVRPDAARPEVTIDKVEIEKEEPLKAELSSFLEAVRTRTVPKVSGEDGRRALAVALQVVDLIKSNPGNAESGFSNAESGS
ncbi:MAG: Gfo/Idh/MocA family oxidoreductase [Nitrospirae bacterium]|nr:Gfo/Idh/MocA family oxidoreductase [Candidatus Manganitrophaceae bacterium]